MSKAKKTKQDSVEETSKDPVGLKTTVDNSNKPVKALKALAQQETKRPESAKQVLLLPEVKVEEVPATPLAIAPAPEAISQAVLSESERNMMRDRRNTPEGRRGRFAEKAPPGTRTKMLKIIYERKAEIQEKRRYLRIVKIVVGILLAASIIVAGNAGYEVLKSSAVAAYESLDVQNWWGRFTTPVQIKQPEPIRPQRLEKRQITTSVQAVRKPLRPMTLIKPKPQASKAHLLQKKVAPKAPSKNQAKARTHR